MLGEEINMRVHWDDYAIQKSAFSFQEEPGQGQSDDLPGVLGVVDEFEGQFA